MTASSTPAPLIAAGRRALPWLVGPAALMMRSRGVELTRPSACPGVLELVSIAAVRINPDLRVGVLLDTLHIALFVAAIAAFVTLTARRISRPAIAAVTGLAIAVGPLFPDTLAPPLEAAAFGACAAAALLALQAASPRSRPSRRAFVQCIVVFLACALVVPAWLLVAAGGALSVGAMTWPQRNRRWVAGLVAAALVVVMAPAILMLSRPGVLTGSSSWRALASCVAPAPALAPGLSAVSTVTWWLGAFALGLAALGAVGEWHRAGWRGSATVAAAVAAAMLLAAGAGTNAPIVIMPLLLVLWCLAAAGLDALAGAIGRGPWRVAVAAAVILVLPAVEASRRVSELRDDRVPPRGHDAQTLRQTIAMLDLVPQDAVFVEEDATVDILLRAAVFGGRRRSKPVTVVAPRQEEVALARAGHTVCVFPWAQTDLSLRGFAVEPAAARLGPSTALAGLAVITGTRPCADVGANWGPLPPTSGRVALSADAETTVGPVVMYFGGDGVAGPGPDRWPSRTLRGFRVATFDQRDAEQSRRLKGEAADVQLPAGDRVLAAPTVVRLTLHRTPRAPLAFAAILGAPFPLGTAKFEQGAAAVGRFTVCDAPAVPIAMLAHPE